MLKNSVENGTCKKLKNSRFEIAAKTGTVGVNNRNNENSDLWNISYSPEKTLCVWCGSTNNKLLNSKLTGGNLPTIIARNIYNNFDYKQSKFYIPSSVEKVKISKLELDNNKKVILSSPSTPDRFIIESYFSIDNKPKEISTLFDKIENVNLNLNKLENNCSYLTFECKNYLEYELIRESEDDRKVLCKIKNKSGLYSYVDYNLPKNNFYNYYLQVRFADFLKKADGNTSNLISLYIK